MEIDIAQQLASFAIDDDAVVEVLHIKLYQAEKWEFIRTTGQYKLWEKIFAPLRQCHQT
jgi:hypothetical protein